MLLWNRTHIFRSHIKQEKFIPWWVSLQYITKLFSLILLYFFSTFYDHIKTTLSHFLLQFFATFCSCFCLKAYKKWKKSSRRKNERLRPFHICWKFILKNKYKKLCEKYCRQKNVSLKTFFIKNFYHKKYFWTFFYQMF